MERAHRPREHRAREDERDGEAERVDRQLDRRLEAVPELPASTRIAASTGPIHGAAHTAKASPRSTNEPRRRAPCSSPAPSSRSGQGSSPMKASPKTMSTKPAICLDARIGSERASDQRGRRPQQHEHGAGSRRQRNARSDDAPRAAGLAEAVGIDGRYRREVPGHEWQHARCEEGEEARDERGQQGRGRRWDLSPMCAGGSFDGEEEGGSWGNTWFPARERAEGERQSLSKRSSSSSTCCSRAGSSGEAATARSRVGSRPRRGARPRRARQRGRRAAGPRQGDRSPPCAARRGPSPNWSTSSRLIWAALAPAAMRPDVRLSSDGRQASRTDRGWYDTSGRRAVPPDRRARRSAAWRRSRRPRQRRRQGDDESDHGRRASSTQRRNRSALFAASTPPLISPRRGVATAVDAEGLGEAGHPPAPERRAPAVVHDRVRDGVLPHERTCIALKSWASTWRTTRPSS